MQPCPQDAACSGRGGGDAGATQVLGNHPIGDADYTSTLSPAALMVFQLIFFSFPDNEHVLCTYWFWWVSSGCRTI